MIASSSRVSTLLLAAVALADCAAPRPAPTPATPDRPSGSAAVLFWSQAQKESGFARMETLFPTHVVKRGAQARPLPAGAPLQLDISIDGGSETVEQFMSEQRTAGLLVIQDGQLRLERYALGDGEQGRWTSFSVAKSITSTLVGAAIRDGAIQSVDDVITRYITGLKGSAYEGVTIRQVLTMTSGVKWNEDYTDPDSDVSRLFGAAPEPGLDSTVSYMRKLPREAAPGSKWVYKTGETNLIGVLVSAATHRTLADYLSEKIWRPYGMEQDAAWMIDERGQEAGGCCLSASLRDFGRFGMFILGGGLAGGKPVLPEGWIASATRKQAEIGEPGLGYGYQWWTQDDGTFNALGIFGQAIHLDPKRKLVIVTSSAWPQATGREPQAARAALFDAVARALDRSNP